MKLTRWQTPETSVWPAVGRLFGLRDELDRLFESPFADLTSRAGFLRIWNPAVDVYEEKDNIIVQAELAGMKKEDIEVSLHDGVLSLSGERKSEKQSGDAGTYRSERFVGRFHRALTLPTQVKADQVAANYKDGVLTITLPKAEEAKTKQIEVKVN